MPLPFEGARVSWCFQGMLCDGSVPDVMLIAEVGNVCSTEVEDRFLYVSHRIASHGMGSDRIGLDRMGCCLSLVVGTAMTGNYKFKLIKYFGIFCCFSTCTHLIHLFSTMHTCIFKTTGAANN